jgi:MFS family permease
MVAGGLSGLRAELADFITYERFMPRFLKEEVLMATSMTRASGGEQLSPEARRSMIGGIASLLVDSYDIYLPAFVLPAAMGYFEPPTLPASIKVTLVTLIFAVTLLARPIGGPIFGNLSDKWGRKRVTMFTASGFTVTTFVTALIPGYQAWGYWSIAALLFLRLVAGVFLGGGYAGPVPLAIERSPKHLRGLVGGMIAAGAPVAILFISLTQLAFLARLSPAAYQTWGWRMPYLFGVILGILYLIYYSRVPELETTFLESKRAREPLWELFSRGTFKNLVQVFLLMSGMWFAAQMVLSFLPGLLIGILHQSPKNVSTLEILANVVTALGMIGYAALSQRIGRRRMLVGIGISILVGESLAYLLMVMAARSGSGFFLIGFLALIAFFLANSPLGCVVVYLNERFPTRVRGSAYGTAYTVSLILPSLYSFWLLWLSKIVPYAYTALILIVLGGILFLWAALWGPETRDVVLLEPSQEG